MPIGQFRWLTVVSAGEPDGTQLVLEPSENPAAQAFKKALFEQGIPLTAFEVEDIQAEYERLKGLGVEFRSEPTKMGETTLAMFADTCGNWIQFYQV